MRMSVDKASKIIRNHYGNENVLQVRKPYGKNFYIADLLSGSFTFSKEEILKLS